MLLTITSICAGYHCYRVCPKRVSLLVIYKYMYYWLYRLPLTFSSQENYYSTLYMHAFPNSRAGKFERDLRTVSFREWHPLYLEVYLGGLRVKSTFTLNYKSKWKRFVWWTHTESNFLDGTPTTVCRRP